MGQYSRCESGYMQSRGNGEEERRCKRGYKGWGQRDGIGTWTGCAMQTRVRLFKQGNTRSLFLDIPSIDLNLLVTTTEHHITVIVRLTAVVSLLRAAVLCPPAIFPHLAPDSASSSILSRSHGTPCTSLDLSLFPFPLHVESLNMHHRTSGFYE